MKGAAPVPIDANAAQHAERAIVVVPPLSTLLASWGWLLLAIRDEPLSMDGRLRGRDTWPKSPILRHCIVQATVLRGSVLRNTAHVVGLVIYAGEESTLATNSLPTDLLTD